MRQIFLDCKKLPLRRLQKKAGELVGALTEKLAEDGFDTLDNLASPRKQNDLFVAQKGFAMSDGNPDLKSVLVKLVSESLEEADDFSLNAIILSESIEVASKLTKSQVSLLTLMFIFLHLKFQVLNNVDDLIKLVEDHLEPLSLEDTDFSNAQFLHLEYLSCIDISSVGRMQNLGQLFLRQYPGLFSKGHDEEQITSRFPDKVLPKLMFLKCLNDPEKIQVAALDERTIEAKATELKWTNEQIEIAKSVLKENLMSADEVESMIGEKSPKCADLFKKWKTPPMSRSRLTSVSRAIAHNYTQMITDYDGEFNL